MSWDKAATIRFRRPGRTRLTASFVLEPGIVDGIREEPARVPKLDRVFTVALVDEARVVHVVVEKAVQVSRRQGGSG